MTIRLFTVLLFSLILTGCAAGQKTASSPQAPENDHGRQSYFRIKEALSQSGETIDYDTLFWIHQKMTRKQPPIPHSGELLWALIRKKNDNPRIDNMILILAAHTIGNSQTAIENVYGLFETMLTIDHRLNTWVLAFIGDAIGKYPHDIPEGDHLADLLERKVAQHIVDSDPPKEFFGYHFMPPPGDKHISNYIAGIEDQQIRVFERNCYFNLIHNKWTEAQIEKALRQLQTQGIPGTGEKSLRPLKYLVRHPDQFLSNPN